MKTSSEGIELIKRWEGVCYLPYKCPAGLWTVGVGHVLYPRQGALPIDQRGTVELRQEDRREFSTEEVDGILRNDLRRFEHGVNRLCPIFLTQGMFDSLVSFSFNLGLGTLQRSTLRQKLLRGDKAGAADEFLKYCLAGGKVLRGLKRRRAAELALFLS